ncbi:hypothetical protein D9613_009724 [Agrocybe pediades]|uniref:DUF6533 domain-containing protein n=1 Tax=Agrocybe pediades TaxID=84607 RepID=A0A8H4QXI2_9AGAR|nr:hypothetical protein D9613_009724 [Agrocybe pediades]
MESLLEGTELHDLARRELKKSFNLRNYLSLFALILVFLDSIWSIKAEYKFIWPAPRGPRFLYLWSRYVALATLIAHYVFVHVVLSEGPVSPFRCQVWFAVLAVSCVSLQCALDAILILRIYALYLRNPKIFILLTLVAIPYLIAFILVVRNVLKEDAFNHHCDLKHTPIEAVPLGVMTILSHLAMWLATYSRRNIAEGRATVVDLVVKGGHWALALLFLR